MFVLKIFFSCVNLKSLSVPSNILIDLSWSDCHEINFQCTLRDTQDTMLNSVLLCINIIFISSCSSQICSISSYTHNQAHDMYLCSQNLYKNHILLLPKSSAMCVTLNRHLTFGLMLFSFYFIISNRRKLYV